MHVFLFLFFLILPLYSQPLVLSAISYNGNPLNMNLTKFIENIDIPMSVFQCQSSFYSPDDSGFWNFTQIAHAFFEFGVKPWNFPNSTNPYAHISECVAALVIVAGECHKPADTNKLGCTIQTGPSGVFQTDFLRTVPGFPNQDNYVMSLCLSAYGAGFLTAPWLAQKDRTCTLSLSNGTSASFYTCYKSHATVNEYNCSDPGSVDGTTYSNFIGPFCHKSYSSRWSACTSRCPLCNEERTATKLPFLTIIIRRQKLKEATYLKTFVGKLHQYQFNLQMVLPQTALQKITLPQMAPPQITLPQIALPKITLPKITLPQIALPKITLPQMAIIQLKKACHQKVWVLF